MRQLHHQPILPRNALSLARAGLGVGAGVGLALAIGSVRRRPALGGELATGPNGPSQPQGGALPGAAASSARPTAALASVQAELLARLDRALEQLRLAPEGDFERAVHDTRKAIKRSRSLLRLLRDELPSRRRRRANAALRAAGRTLGASRDADVALATLDGVLARSDKRLGKSRGTARLRERLERERSAASARLRAGARERALSELWRARAELSAIGVAHKGRGGDGRALASGTSRIYGKGRSAMRSAKRKPSIVAMHTWRKRVKDLRYASEALADEAEKSDRTLDKLAHRADKLGETLGEDHDLAVLAGIVRANKKLFRRDRRGRRALLKAIAKRRRKLRRRALRHGLELYDRKPKRFERRMRRALG